MKRPHYSLRRFSGTDLARRITGFSTPFGGLSWTAPAPEADAVRAFLTVLEDRRALFAPYHVEMEFAVAQSIEEVRHACTETISALQENSRAVEHIRAIRVACRQFSDKAPEAHDLHRGRGFGREASALFFTALGELRALIGVQVMALAYTYKLELEGDLASIIPPEPSADHDG